MMFTKGQWFLLLFAIFCMSAEARGQSRMRGHVLLPRTQGATVLSTYINASANRLLAMGDFLESAAIARRIHLEADRVAMENSVQWIETYFERKRLNKEYREADRIDYLESRTLRNLTSHQRVMKGEGSSASSESLNYILRTIIGDQNAYPAICLNDKPDMESEDLFLTPNDIARIRISTGGGDSFQLSNPDLVDDVWPKVLNDPAFELMESEYKAARADVLNEIQNGDLSQATFEKLIGLLMKLEQAFDENYQYKKRKDSVDIATFVEEKEMGRRFFLSQRTGALRAFASNDPKGFESQRRFDGDKLSDLIKYCAMHRFEFSDPDLDGVATYAKLYSSMREIYAEFIPKAPQY